MAVFGLNFEHIQRYTALTLVATLTTTPVKVYCCISGKKKSPFKIKKNRMMLKQLTTVGTSEHTRQLVWNSMLHEWTLERKGCSHHPLQHYYCKNITKSCAANQKVTKQEMAQLCPEEKQKYLIKFS